jgi:CRP-like cAMP-binding protein
MDRHEGIEEQFAQLELFRGLKRGVLRTMSSLITVIELPPGSVLTREGRPGSQFMIVLEGSVAVSACDRVIAMRGPGDFLGEISILATRTQTATALAITPVVLAVAARAEFWSMLAVPPIAERVRGAMAQRLAEMQYGDPDPAAAV